MLRLLPLLAHLKPIEVLQAIASLLLLAFRRRLGFLLSGWTRASAATRHGHKAVLVGLLSETFRLPISLTFERCESGEEGVGRGLEQLGVGESEEEVGLISCVGESG